MLERGHGHDVAHAHERIGENDEWTGPTWTEKELKSYIERNGACILVIEGYAVDVTRYMKIHVRSLSYFPFIFFFQCRILLLMDCLQPGGMELLRDYEVPVKGDGGNNKWKEASWAFNGGVNKHSLVARRKLRQLRVALLN